MLNTATITKELGLYIVRFTRGGSFWSGYQHFGNVNAALRFCRERGLAVDWRA